jgi:hypothetical protein
MSLRSLLDRSRDALFAIANKAAPALVQMQSEDINGESVMDMGYTPGHLAAGGWGLFGGSMGGARTVLFWLFVLAMMLLLGKLFLHHSDMLAHAHTPISNVHLPPR